MSLEEPKPEEQKELKPLVMTITLNPKGVSVAFPLIQDKIASYGTLKLAENQLDEFYNTNQQPLIQPTKG